MTTLILLHSLKHNEVWQIKHLTGLSYFDRIVLTRKDNMITGKQFKITYYSNKDAKHITRNALWDSKSKYFESKNGNNCMTYWDIDANGYRTATKSWSVRS